MKNKELGMENLLTINHSSLTITKLSALTSNRAKRSDNFYNFLTSREVLHAKLKELRIKDEVLERY